MTHNLRRELGDKNLKIGHLNVNGLTSKFREIQLILSDINFDILGITETHLSEDVSNEWISINNYNLARKDRDRHGGGVLIYYKECLTINPVHKWDAHNIEAIWLNVTMRSQSFLIGCLYKHLTILCS